MKSIFFLITVSLLGLSANAQLPEYYVYLTYGDITVQHEGKISKAQPKQQIYSQDIIQIKDKNSEIELANNEGYFIVLNTRAVYKVDTLKNRLTQKKGGLFGKYLKLVWEAIYHPSSDFNLYKDESIAASWGGGARGNNCGIEKFPPASGLFSNDSLVFKWSNLNSSNPYQFSLFDRKQNPIIELLVRDTQLVLITSSLSFGDYYWSISSKDHPCVVNKNKFTIISKEKEDSLSAGIRRSIPPNKDPILYNLQISDALGSKGLIEKALEYFNKSWELYMGMKSKDGFR